MCIIRRGIVQGHTNIYAMVQALPLCALLSLSMGNSLSGCSAGTIEAMVKKESIDASGC